MHKINIDLVVKSGTLENQGLDLTIFCNDSMVWQKTNITEELTPINLESFLPLTMMLQVSGKKHNDTLIGDATQILADKFLRVDYMCINRMWIKKWVIEKKLFQSDFGCSNYFGHNGLYYFRIPSTDILDFWIDTMTVDQ